MTTRHTPGPWRTDGRPANECVGIDREGRNWQIHVERDNVTVVARCHGATGTEAEHNARLIASAPELLSVLVRLTEKTERANAIQHSGGTIEPEDWSELFQISNDARAVIAKATGET